MSQIFFCLQPGVNGYGSVCHEPCSKTNFSSRFFRRRREGCHFRFRAPANHLASTLLPPGQAILLGLLYVTQVRLLLIQTAVIPLPSSQWDITWHMEQIIWIMKVTVIPIWELILIYCGLFFCPHLDSFFLCCFFFHYVSAKFHLWPSSGDLPRPRIGMLSLVTVSPVITAFHSCCLSHHVFDQVNLWPAWVGFETAIFWRRPEVSIVRR